MDTGGYFHATDELNNTEYRELFVRWHQFASFTPVLRQHGRKGGNITPGGGSEYYLFGGNVTAAIKAAHDLRYRLMPYIYSTFAIDVASEVGSSLQRALPFEFETDRNVRQTHDAFMFGRALLVFPILEFQQMRRRCYLPKVQVKHGGVSGSWTDFWTGYGHAPGSTVTTSVTLAHLPLYVRPGSLVVLGPTLQWASEKPAEPLELRIYRGGNATFTLYEDDGKTMAYTRRGQYSTIEFTWHESSSVLNIGTREGDGYAGDLLRKSRTIEVVLVRPGHGVGAKATTTPDKCVTYTGAPLNVDLSAL